MSARELIVTQDISLDGVVDLHGGWMGGVDASEVMATFATSMRGEGAFLFGRHSFEQFRAHWPTQADHGRAVGEMPRHVAAVDKRVVSSTLTDPGWGGRTPRS